MRDYSLDEESEASHLPLHGRCRCGRAAGAASEVSWMSSSTSSAVAVLADRRGSAAPPSRLGESVEVTIETVKHPSPSTYPEMYDGDPSGLSESPRIAPSVDLPLPDRTNRV